ncbi:hypothetical protein BKG77_06995 [Mycobacteroides chelonae]|uniref:hypothetical protein n=1 Tax=Mycobacteroides chelonae TaxID=1774 RepID=UPI0008A95295|nr:hypothetical protein [Mycobacteroides chelonae]OHU23405.1 hypothetical protein BKG77_06995 [Mycobacteroides chelonae]
MSISTLPVHPATGLQALGFGKRGPIWPVVGASEDPPNPEDPTPDPDEPLGEGGKKALAAEREARGTAETLAKDLQKQLDAANQKLADAKSADQPEWQQKLDELQGKLDAEIEARTTAEKDKAAAQRVTYGIDKGLPKALATKLVGTTDEELDAEIEELLTLLGTPGPQPNPQQGNPSKGRGGSIEAGRAKYEESKKK